MTSEQAIASLTAQNKQIRPIRCAICGLPAEQRKILSDLFRAKRDNPAAFTWPAMSRWLQEQGIIRACLTRLKDHADGTCPHWNNGRVRDEEKTPSKRR